MLPNFPYIGQVSTLANSCQQLAVFFPQPAGSGLQPAPSGIPRFSGQGEVCTGLGASCSQQRMQGARVPKLRRASRGGRKLVAALLSGLCLRMLPATALFVHRPGFRGQKPSRTCEHLQHRGIRGVSMRPTFCSLQRCGSCLRLAVRSSLDRSLSEDKAPCSCKLGREQPGIVKFRSDFQS